MFFIERKRITFIFIIFCLLFIFGILGKAFKVQIIDRKELIAYYNDQILRTSKIYPNRGNIYDRNGFPLAINIQTYSIFTIPKNVGKNLSVYKKLSKIVKQLGHQEIKKKIYKRKRYTWLARKILLTKSQVEQIKKLNGIYIEAVPKRLYPNNELLSQALGFVGVDNIGLAGLEYKYDKELRGEPRVIKYLQDAKGRPIKFESIKIEGQAQDFWLSIDKDLQSIAEKTLKDTVIKYKAKKGGIGVMDAENGEILAIANFPTFNPNEVKKSKEEHRKLSFISDPIEPGSIFKTFTVCSAIEHEVAKPDTNYYCERGALKVQDHIIKEADNDKKFEWLSVEEILKYSSNIGTTKIAFDLTFPKLKKTLREFNFGEKTGIEIPGESRGIFNFKKNISPLSLSNISFGQGVATTGIQILAAYSAIANGGHYVLPTIFKRKHGKFFKKRIISKKTSDQLTKILVKAVDHGTGTNARIPHFVIAGKTSTAQRPIKGGGGYKGYIPGFVGFPLNVNRKFVIYIYIDDPQGSVYYGNSVAVPVFKKIAQHILYKSKDLKHLALDNKHKERKIFDTVKIVRSSTRFTGANRIPNFLGLDKKSSKILAKKYKLKIDQRGMGLVISQGPKAGSLLDKNVVVKLNYALPKYE